MRKRSSGNAQKKTPEVFTAEFIKGLPEMNRFSNPIVIRLCKDTLPSNIRIREAIESWFTRLEPQDKSSMLSRLHSTNDPEHLSAFFELGLQNYFESSGFEVEKDPELADHTTPDFRLVIGSRDIYVEVRTIMMDENARRAQKSMTEALLQLDKISTEYRQSLARYGSA